MDLNIYSYISPTSISPVTTIEIALPIIREEDITSLVSLINKEIADLTNYTPGTITTTNEKIESVVLSRYKVVSQILDLEYRLLLYLNASTTKEELLLVSNVKEAISIWKTLLNTDTNNWSSLAKEDPDYTVILYYLDYITYYTYVSSIAQWLDIYNYVQKITPILESLKSKYVNDFWLIAYENLLNTTLDNLKKCSELHPPI